MEDSYIQEKLKIIEGHLKQALGFANGTHTSREVPSAIMISKNLKWSTEHYMKLIGAIRNAADQAKKDADYINLIK